MPGKQARDEQEWSIGVRVWAEREGQAVLGPGRLELLEGIDRLRSLARAAQEMKLSYRKAWNLVQSINAAAGEPVVLLVAGGTGGGGATLTSFGQRLITRFRQMTNQIHDRIQPFGPVAATREKSLHLLAAVSLEEVVGRLLADYATIQPDLRIRAVFGASDELADLIQAGTPADLFLTANPGQLARLRPAPSHRCVIAANTLAIIASSECSLDPAPARQLLRSAGLRLARARPGCPLGDYTQRLFESARLTTAATGTAVWVENSAGVVSAVRSGQADLGIVYGSDTQRANGCRVLCRMSQGSLSIRYEGAVFTTRPETSAAVDLLHFLASEDASKRFHECGFSPLSTTRTKNQGNE